MTLTMPIEKMLCSMLLVASHVNGESTQTRFLPRQLGSVVCTKELCQQRYTNFNNAGTLTGYFYSGDDIPTKGCFIKGDSMYFGTGGTDREISGSDLEGAKTRVWCDATSSNVDVSGNDRVCSTEEQCKARYTTMKNSGVIQGFFYASSDFPTKGCFIKGDSMYFGTGGTDRQISGSDLTGQQRVWCDADRSSVVFEESTSEEISSGEDEEEEASEERSAGEDEEEDVSNDSIEEWPSFNEDGEDGGDRDESGVESQGCWSLYTMIVVAAGVAAIGRHEFLC